MMPLTVLKPLHFELSPETVSREYNRILQITPIFSNLHRREGK
jgi:hypothetical protein